MRNESATRAAIAHILDTVTIPTLPGVVQRINRLLNDPEAGMPEVAALIVQEGSISAKVLRMANSAYYGLAQPVVSIPQAALVLGGQVLRNIAMRRTLAEIEPSWTISAATSGMPASGSFSRRLIRCTTPGRVGIVTVSRMWAMAARVADSFLMARPWGRGPLLHRPPEGGH